MFYTMYLVTSFAMNIMVWEYKKCFDFEEDQERTVTNLKKTSIGFILQDRTIVCDKHTGNIHTSKMFKKIHLFILFKHLSALLKIASLWARGKYNSIRINK